MRSARVPRSRSPLRSSKAARPGWPSPSSSMLRSPGTSDLLLHAQQVTVAPGGVVSSLQVVPSHDWTGAPHRPRRSRLTGSTGTPADLEALEAAVRAELDGKFAARELALKNCRRIIQVVCQRHPCAASRREREPPPAHGRGQGADRRGRGAARRAPRHLLRRVLLRRRQGVRRGRADGGAARRHGAAAARRSRVCTPCPISRVSARPSASCGAACSISSAAATSTTAEGDVRRDGGHHRPAARRSTTPTA